MIKKTSLNLAFLILFVVLLFTYLFGSIAVKIPIPPVIELFVLKITPETALFLALFVYLFLIKPYQLTSTATFKITLGFLFILFLLFPFHRHPTQPNSLLEKLAVLIYLFLVIGVIQQFRELKG